MSKGQSIVGVTAGEGSACQYKYTTARDMLNKYSNGIWTCLGYTMSVLNFNTVYNQL